jgi:hypothetical protein
MIGSSETFFELGWWIHLAKSNPSHAEIDEDE